jgi:hypothetical protein
MNVNTWKSSGDLSLHFSERVFPFFSYLLNYHSTIVKNNYDEGIKLWNHSCLKGENVIIRVTIEAKRKVITLKLKNWMEMALSVKDYEIEHKQNREMNR